MGSGKAMAETPSRTDPPDYGLDAPGVVRNMFLGCVIGFTLFGVTLSGLWSGRLALGPAIFPLGTIGLLVGGVCLLLGSWMIWESKAGKIRGRERLLDQIQWAGAEQVLDVGCGRGLMLLGAAKRLTTGTACGIDIWQTEDLSGNSREAAQENARGEQVAERVQILTADMRKLPFADATFDVILSSNAIHNIYDPEGRDQAIAEICRVLKPGGRILIVDIRHSSQYVAALRRAGVSEVLRIGSVLIAVVVSILTLGSLYPATLLGRKS
jgi:protein-L-isoaspartate O-methyltransferase